MKTHIERPPATSSTSPTNKLEVHKGEDDIDDHADADGDGLDDHVPIIIIEIAGGAVDQGQAVAAGRET